MPTINEQIVDESIKHGIWLERYKQGLARRVLSLLVKAEDDLVGQLAGRIAKIEERGLDIGPETTKRIEDMIQSVRAQQRELFSEVNGMAASDLKELANYEVAFQNKMLTDAAAPVVTLNLVEPNKGLLNAIVTTNPFQGRLLSEWFSGLSNASAQRISDAVKIGMAEGQTTDQIVRRIRGTRAAGYADGLLAITRRDAANIVGTATAHVTSQARANFYAANEDILPGEQWVSALDSRTCPRCAAMDGKTFKVGQGPQTPLHFGPCRCVRVPYFGPTTVKGTRASMFGPVPEDTKYADWLRRQSPEIQNEVLGVSKAKLFREGGLPLERFVDDTGKTYSLSQLRQRDRGTFDDVFAGAKPVTKVSQRKQREIEFKEYLGTATYKRFTQDVNKVLKASGAPTHGLTQAEKVAIHAYTSGEKYFQRLNSALRSNDAVEIARVAPMANILDAALAKLPTYEGPVLFRVTNLPDEVAKKLRGGRKFSDPAFMSASKADLGKAFGTAHLFTIVGSRQGKEIAGFSAYRSEQEVLFPRGAKFDIIRARTAKQSTAKEIILSDTE